MKRSPISLIHVFTFLSVMVTICFIGISTISNRGMDRVGTQFNQLSHYMLPLALSNSRLTKNVLQQVKFMNDGLHSNDITSLMHTQTEIERYQQLAEVEISNLKANVTSNNSILSRVQENQLLDHIQILDSKSSKILAIQNNILTINTKVKDNISTLRYGLSSIGPEMNRISHFLIADNNKASEAASRFVSSAIALESTFLILMAEENNVTAKGMYNEMHNRTAALELAFDDLSVFNPEIKTYMSLIAPYDIVKKELNKAQSIPHLLLTKLSLVEEQKGLINTASETSLTVTELLSNISKDIDIAMKKRTSLVTQSIDSYKKIILTISIVLIIVLLISTLLIRSWMSRGLNNIIHHLKHLTEYNYQHDVAEIGPMEMQIIARNLNKVITTTTYSMQSMSNNCDSLYQTSEISKTVSSDIEDGLIQQNSALSSMTDVVIQLESSIGEIALLTQKSHCETREATQAAINGLNVITNNNGRLTKLNNALGQNVQAIDMLDTQIEKIQYMVGVIANLAESTNLLALNAAIEAARAGEQGRGFAVVANEIRELAGNTSMQTTNIRKTMQALTTAANEAKDSIELSQTEMSLSLESSIEVSQTFEQISNTVTYISDRISQVSTATEQQAHAATEVSNNISHINQHGEKIGLQLATFVESSEKVANIASQQRELITTYCLSK